MSEQNNPWRDKYRRSLAQQEQLEKTLAAQQSILHRAVTTLCSAAEGYDTGLDERLQAILASVKHNDVAGFDRMLKSLPRVTEEVGQRQQRHWQEICKALANIASQVQQQSPSADVKPNIKHFKKQLPKGVLIPATLKRLLQQLSDLQQQAISNSPKSSSGLFGKLFGDKADDTEKPTTDTPSENDSENETGTRAEEADWEEIGENDISAEGEVIDGEAEVIGYQRERNIPEAILQQEYKEESSPDVPDRVSIILVELLDHFKTVPAAQQKATKARQRIQQGLRWFELAPTLEDIRDFVLQAYIGADNDYQQYLEHLYGELSEVLNALGISIETEQQVRDAADHLHSSVNEGMATITLALNDHSNIDSLKQAVESHVQQLQVALSDYKQQSEPPEDRESLAVQLQALASKVQQMEQNEEDIRHRLEEEKQRAVTDSLTGLPNREAYNERSHQEMQRWERYKHPLTLAVIDIDFFKKINDNYGHQTGDKVLKIVSNAVVKRLREVDFMARFGGEEFVLLLPETDGEKALEVLNRIREALANAPFRYKNEKITITVSIGIAEFTEGDTCEKVFERADEALYKAKETGRNKCCLAE